MQEGNNLTSSNLKRIFCGIAAVILLLSLSLVDRQIGINIMVGIAGFGAGVSFLVFVLNIPLDEEKKTLLRRIMAGVFVIFCLLFVVGKMAVIWFASVVIGIGMAMGIILFVLKYLKR